MLGCSHWAQHSHFINRILSNVFERKNKRPPIFLLICSSLFTLNTHRDLWRSCSTFRMYNVAFSCGVSHHITKGQTVQNKRIKSEWSNPLCYGFPSKFRADFWSGWFWWEFWWFKAFNREIKKHTFSKIKWRWMRFILRFWLINMRKQWYGKNCIIRFLTS